MNTIRLRLPLNDDEYEALLQLARAELRGPVDEIHFILRVELERVGLLPVHEAVITPASAAAPVETNSGSAAGGQHVA